MHIELLVVPDCPNEAAVGHLIRTALADVGVKDATITTTVVADDQEAALRGFIGSPTILVNNVDPFARPGSPTGLTCRIYSTVDGPTGTPTLRDIRQALKCAADSN